MKAASRTTTSAALPALGLVVACGLFGWLWADYRNYWLDDAFITFRYARHLAEGIGPVFNPGERVEGYTSPLWMALAALPFRFGSPFQALIAYKGFALLASLWVLYRIWSFPSPQGRVRRYWVVVLACQPIFVLNAGDGMETPLVVLGMVECLVALQRSPGFRSGARVGAWTAVMILARPESLPLLLALPGLMAYAHRADAEGRAALKDWLRGFALAGLLPVLAHEVARLAYYGQPFPNTYYAKATGSQLERLARGGRDLARFLFDNPWRAPVALWVAIGLAAVATSRLRPRARPPVVIWFASLWLMIGFRVSFDLWSGSDTMGRHRFLAPLLGPLFILADEGARMLFRGFGRVAVVALLCLSLYYNVTGHHSHAETIAWYQRGLERAHIALGHWLRERLPEDATLAIADAGAVPFTSRLETIDLWGLNDAVIAHMPGEYGNKEGMADYVLSREPDVVVLWNQRPFLDGNLGRLLGGQPLDEQIATHPAFAAHYRFAREFVFRDQRPGIPGYYLDVFERRSAGPVLSGDSNP